MTSLKQIAGSMIVIGIVLAMIGFASGGKWLILLSDTGFHVPKNQSLSTKSYELDAFTNIHLLTKHADIEILPSDHYALEVKSFDTKDISYSVKDGTLTVETKNAVDNAITIGFGSFHSPTITVYIPRDAKLSTIDLDASFGDISLEQLTTQQLNLLVSHGDVSFEKIVAETTEITQSFGDLTFQEFTSSSLIVENEHGDIDIDGELNGKSTITSSFGDIDLALLNKESDLGLNLNSSFGEITVNDTSMEGDFSQSHEGNNQLEVSITHGDLDLSLK